MPTQQQPFPEFYESANDALIDLVKALGGFKPVGARLWPEEPPDRAGNKLRDCLSSDRREKLSLEQALLLLKWARDAGHHGAMAYLCYWVGYDTPRPSNPEDEAAALQREFVSAVEKLGQIQAQLGMAAKRGTRR